MVKDRDGTVVFSVSYHFVNSTCESWSEAKRPQNSCPENGYHGPIRWSHTVRRFLVCSCAWAMILTENRCIFGRFDCGDVGAQAFQQRVFLLFVLNVSTGICIFIKL